MNRYLKPWIFLAGRPRSAFQLCGTVGLLLALGVSALLIRQSGHSIGVAAAMAGGAVLTFFALAMATKIWCGEERLIYYHHEIAVLVVIAAIVRLLQQPLAPYLDVAALGLGVFLACGRIGCLMVGCCHGRLWSHGVRYGPEHAREGFPPCYVGARLFPVQLLESMVVAATVAVGVTLVLRGFPAGWALAWYVSAYAVARFALEFLRGDADRPSHGGFSEAQWTSLLVAGAAAFAGPSGRIAFGLIAAWMIVVAVARMVHGRRPIQQPRHLRELAAALSEENRGWVVVRSTSLGIHVSSGKAPSRGGPLRHYALSGCTAREAQKLAVVILRLKHTRAASPELVAGEGGVYHLLVRDSTHA